MRGWEGVGQEVRFGDAEVRVVMSVRHLRTSEARSGLESKLAIIRQWGLLYVMRLGENTEGVREDIERGTRTEPQDPNVTRHRTERAPAQAPQKELPMRQK